MKERDLHKAQGRRLQSARVAAGFSSARSAALAHNWPESTYRAHEAGTRTIGQDDAARYINGFRSDGAKGFTGMWILYGDELPDESLDDLLKDKPPSVRAEAIRAVRNLLNKQTQD